MSQEAKKALSELLQCPESMIIELESGRFRISSKQVWMTGNDLPSGVPSDPGISLIREYKGYKIYGIR